MSPKFHEARSSYVSTGESSIEDPQRILTCSTLGVFPIPHFIRRRTFWFPVYLPVVWLDTDHNAEEKQYPV